MEREILARILARAPGVSADGDRFVVEEKHQATFYLAQRGQAIVVADVAECSLEDGFVGLVARNHGDTTFAAYESVAAVKVEKPRGDSPRRAGFS